MNRIVTISFTPLDAPGGVPQFNRDLHAAFPDREVVHYSWWDFPWYIEVDNQLEWEKARTLNHYLINSRKLLPTDVVIGDGFWVDGLQHLKYAVSHSHGIWSHLTKADVDAGKKPENPFHHAAQVAFRQSWLGFGKHMTAVSEFIYKQMEYQWGFKADRVINNGVDTDLFVPTTKRFPRHKPIIVHGVNDRNNTNKGWDHIAELKLRADTDPEMICEVLSLDEMIEKYGGPKEWALSQANMVVHPSGYEGNSMFVAESLACGLPIVGYEVGALYSPEASLCGVTIERSRRSPATTVEVTKWLLNRPDFLTCAATEARKFAIAELSKTAFNRNWREYVEEITK